MGEVLLGAAASAFVEKGAEAAGNRAINAIVDFSKKKFGEAQVSLGTAFTLYLKNARQRYNQVKTIATGTQPRLIIADKEKPTEQPLYVQIGVSYREKPLATATVDPLLEISRHLLIEGTGGAGKSMLMRYLFLVTSYRNYVPILLELRRIGRQNTEQVSIQSILELVYACMTDFNVRLNKEQFEYSLFSGKYLFLFDGFDEIPESMAREVAGAIQDFCAKYPNNPCIITSRPREDTAPLETFTTLETMPLTKPQAILLASRIWDEDEKTREFCTQLDAELFDNHKGFAENPLLLTMMFLTFMRNLSIPNHLSEFYQKAYDALYSAHDNQDKGVFKREFKCKTLDENLFASLFAYFCFQSYFKRDYEFTKEQILAYLNAGIRKLDLCDVDASEFLADLQHIVCMIVRDGTLYRFAHRSFQTYFAARYTSALADEAQTRFLDKLLNTDYVAIYQDYYDLLYQLSPDRFVANAMENGLRSFQTEVDAAPNADLFFLKSCFSGINIHGAFRIEDKAKDSLVSLYVSSAERPGESDSFDTISNSPKQSNLLDLLMNYVYSRQFFWRSSLLPSLKKCLYEYLEKSGRSYLIAKIQNGDLRFGELDIDFQEINSTSLLTDEERLAFSQAISENAQIPQLRADVRRWLAEQDVKRSALESTSDLSALLDVL